ncbi:hypothetical protein CCACVL1_25969 [Corchorus capsularis]|uniref:Pentacotripeptide-repeat region of PRORP domain-containing protein n=1 Tax=Corchorus capsularis TaxID=210143 RepID=A0A1R3GGD7_COCAP|nr:hypothetical protein CCACVL1_25969 [Corchorus capsularis]
MWRSIVSRQVVVARNFIASQVLSQSQKPLPKTSLYHTPRFLSHFSANPSDDSSPGFAENGDSQLENFAPGVEADAMELPSSVGDETQMDGFVPGDDESHMEQKPQLMRLMSTSYICSDPKKKVAYDLWDLLKEIGEKENCGCFNELIAFFSKLGKGKAAMEVMLDEENLPEGEQMGKIIYLGFVKGGKAKDAHTVHFLISSLCKKDDTVKLGREMLDGFFGEARKCAIKTFSGAHLLEMQLLIQSSMAISKSGDMDNAKEMIKLMEDRGLKPDVYTYTVVMSGYANCGQILDEACQVLAEAKKNYVKLSPVTYHTLIRGYCKIEEFDNALKLLAQMKDFGVQPNVDEYNKLIQSLCLKALD